MAATDDLSEGTAQHLKSVSRIKHVVLQKYLPAWQRILGAGNRRLCYFDCYAGAGVYEFRDQEVGGSPLIAIEAARGYVERQPGREMTLVLVEKVEKQRTLLARELERAKPYPPRLRVHVMAEDAKEFVPKLLGQVPSLAPSFFLVDPYGHPLTVPILNQILNRPKTEALINFMYYRINMDAENPKVQHLVDEMFGGPDWRTQPFLKGSPQEREQGFLRYFTSQIQARYKWTFRIRYDIEDGVSHSRTKYYLVHASNHPKAVLLMKEVMWSLGDELGVFDFGGERQGRLFSSTPTPDQLEAALLSRFAGVAISFDALREKTWDLPFIEKDYRAVLQQMRKQGRVEITPVTSRTHRGLRGDDRIEFPRE